jgi:hypothetical protein
MKKQLLKPVCFNLPADLENQFHAYCISRPDRKPKTHILVDLIREFLAKENANTLPSEKPKADSSVYD